MPGVDLHIHSTASDGTWAPSAIAAEAGRIGLSAAALTDHDTIVGLAEFLEAGRAAGIEAIPGVELAVRGHYGHMDLVGLWVPPGSARVREAMDWLNAQRLTRNRLIVERLRGLGFDISYDEVAARAGSTVGRPHIAQALMDKGYAGSVAEAFRVYLGSGGKAYAPKEVFAPRQAIELLKGEGATVILAHPGLYNMDEIDLEAFLAENKPLGLDGLEAIYPDYSPEETRRFQNLAARLELAVSGGSDFHGEVKPDLRLGKGYGKLFVPDSVLAGLKALRARQGLTTPAYS